jgi:hypothetical protein
MGEIGSYSRDNPLDRCEKGKITQHLHGFFGIISSQLVEWRLESPSKIHKLLTAWTLSTKTVGTWDTQLQMI